MQFIPNIKFRLFKNTTFCPEDLRFRTFYGMTLWYGFIHNPNFVNTRDENLRKKYAKIWFYMFI